MPHNKIQAYSKGQHLVSESNGRQHPIVDDISKFCESPPQEGHATLEELKKLNDHAKTIGWEDALNTSDLIGSKIPNG